MSLIGCHTPAGTGIEYPKKKPTWRYIKGGEKDFEGAPDWASVMMEFEGQTIFEEHQRPVIGISRYKVVGDTENVWDIAATQGGEIIAQRERVTNDNDDRLLTSLNDLPLVSEKYPKCDMVNHPSHYTQGGIECIDAIKAATVGKTGIEAVCVANVVKYLWRYEEKNGLEDVKKARWYLERLISELSEDE